jgi:multidrug efflux pump subunit AcrA (membrane-fusion protein)
VLRAAEKERVMLGAELDQARTALARDRELGRQGLIPRQQLDSQASLVASTETKWKSAEAKVKAAQAELGKERAGERKVRVMQQELQQTAAQASQARYELEQITVELGPSEVKAPLSGVVTSRKAQEGDVVSEGAHLMTIVDAANAWVQAEVDETVARRLVVGQPLRVVLASGEEFDGKVSFISPVTESAFGVKVALSSAEGAARPGMTASVLIPVPGGLAEPISTVPLPAGAPKEASIEKEPAASPDAPSPDATEREENVASSRPDDAAPTEGEEQPAETAPTPLESKPPQSRTKAPLPSEPDEGASPPPIAEQAATTPDVPPPPIEAPPLERVEPTPVEPAPTVEELLESIDMEDPTEEELQQLEASMLREAAGVDPPEFLLEGISVAEGRPVAVINGARVFEGDTVSGARVILIVGGMVQLAFEGRTITLRF